MVYRIVAYANGQCMIYRHTGKTAAKDMMDTFMRQHRKADSAWVLIAELTSEKMASDDNDNLWRFSLHEGKWIDMLS